MKNSISYFLRIGCLLFVVSLFCGGFARGAVVCGEPQISPGDSTLWSGWSPGQRQAYAKMGQVIVAHMKNSGGRLHLDLPEKEFRSMNLPDTMYGRVVEDLNQMNSWFDSKAMPAAQRAEMYDDYIGDMKQFLINFEAFCRQKGYSVDWNTKP